MYEKVQRQIEILKIIHAEIPLNSVKPLPVVPAINVDIEFPERKLTVRRNTFSENKTV